MEGHVKLFDTEEDKLDEDINNYIQDYKLRNMTYLTPIHTSLIKIKGNNYLMIPNHLQALVSFKQRELSVEEIKGIKHDRKMNAQINDICSGQSLIVRKSEEDGNIVFYLKKKYYDIYKIFNIKINKEFNSIYVSQRPEHIYSFENCIPDELLELIRENKMGIEQFIQVAIVPTLEKILL